MAVHTPGTDFETDGWELYNVDKDFSEAVDLAAQHPARLAEMRKLCWEAAKNGALPLLEAPAGRSRTYNQALRNP